MSTEQERELRTTLITVRRRRRDAIIFELVYALLAAVTGAMAFATTLPAASKQTCWLVCIVALVNAATFAARRVRLGPAVVEAQAALNAHLAEHTAAEPDDGAQA